MPRYLPFEEVYPLADILTLARLLGLELKGSGTMRSACPVHGGDERTLCVTPSAHHKKSGTRGVFFCHKEGSGGDRIGLVAHCLAMGQQEAAYYIKDQFGSDDDEEQRPQPQRPRQEEVRAMQREAPAEPPAQSWKFDPQKFAERLVWSKEVEALGITEDEAARLGIGYYPQRKAVFFPIRNPDHSISGFIGCDDKRALRLPPQWQPEKVVPLKRA